MMQPSTIAAIATPGGNGGIGILKISGPSALDIGFRIVSLPASVNKQTITARRMYLGSVRHEDRLLDEVLFVYMKSPYSYTGEDVVEIQCHSGQAILTYLMNRVISEGAVPAQPGEFTKRAFLSGRIDLSQAEAVIDVIQASSGSALTIAGNHLFGRFRDLIHQLRSRLLEALSMIEAEIDFAEEIPPEAASSGRMVHSLTEPVLTATQNLIERHQKGRFLRDGIRIGIAGRPNVGKSSLLNRLVERDRAIVSPFPGTTRDWLEDRVEFKGQVLSFFDTAGLRKTKDAVERLGVDRAFELFRSCDLILLVLEAGRAFLREDAEILQQVRSRPVFLVLNKSDLVSEAVPDAEDNRWSGLPQMLVSAKFDQDFSTLKTRMLDTLGVVCSESEENDLMPNARQSEALFRAAGYISAAMEKLRSCHPLDMAALELKDAVAAFDEILGLSLRDDLLSEIFSRFCIGK